MVSHDRAFLNATTTKVIVMEKKTLRYFNGSFGEFEVAEMEDAARKAGLLDARVRQEEKARASIEKMKAGAKAHTNLKQAKQKQNKMEVRREGREEKRREERQSTETAKGEGGNPGDSNIRTTRLVLT